MPPKRPAATVTPERLLTQIPEGEIAPVYYFCGGESEREKEAGGINQYLLEKVLDALKLKLVGGNTRDFNFAQYDASDADMNGVMLLARTYPMMRPRRLIILREAHELRSDGYKPVIAYLDDPAPSTCLVFVGRHLPTPNKGGAAARKAVTARASVVPFPPFLKPKEAAPYLQQEAKGMGLRLTSQAETALLEGLGPDMIYLLQALDKLTLVLGGRTTVEANDVALHITRTRQEEIWAFHDALASRKTAEALTRLTAFLSASSTEDELRLMSQLAGLYESLFQMRAGLDRGGSRAAVLDALPGSPWLKEKRLEQARRFPLRRLAFALDRLDRLQFELRSSRADHLHLFTRFVLEVCRA